MAAYVLANKESKDLETTVFASEGGDTVALFTDPNSAQKYLDDAGWQEEMTVASLDTVALMEWLIHCHRNGVQLMATDPVRSDQESGMRLTTMSIEDQLQHAGQHLLQVANPDI